MRMQVEGKHTWVPGLKKDKSGGNPWAAPGKAIVFGDGCGLGGGNKWGCNVQCKGKGDTDCSVSSTISFGTSTYLNFQTDALTLKSL